MNKRHISILVTLVIAAAMAPPAFSVQTHEVTVNDNYYEANDIRIAKGDTVRWTWLGEPHTVSFAAGPDSGSKKRLETWSWTFETDGDHYYQCEIHGAAMSGWVRVGPVCPEGDPDCTPPPRPQIWVPTDMPTLAEAVAHAGKGTIINLEPGVHEVTKTVVVRTDDVTIRGAANPDSSVSTDVTPADVVVRASGSPKSALQISGRGFSMSTATVQSFKDSALDLDGAKHFALASLLLVRNGEYGAEVTNSRFGSIDDVYVTGSSRAGLSIRDCEFCDVTVTKLISEGNFNGFEAVDAGSVILRGSTLRNNANGVVLRTKAKPSTELQDGAHVYGNTILNSGDPVAPAPTMFRADETQELGSGAGIWISGGWRNQLQNNTISGNSYGIAMTALGSAAMFNRIETNTLSGSTFAEIGWDGFGGGNCFSANGEANTEPPHLQTTHGCKKTNGPGVPNPLIHSRLLQHVLGTYYCDHIGMNCKL